MGWCRVCVVGGERARESECLAPFHVQGGNQTKKTTKHTSVRPSVRTYLGVHGEELDDLEEREVLLPPDVLGVHGEEVVGVHDGVDGAVEDHRQEDVPVVARVQVEPVHLCVSWWWW